MYGHHGALIFLYGEKLLLSIPSIFPEYHGYFCGLLKPQYQCSSSNGGLTHIWLPTHPYLLPYPLDYATSYKSF